MRLRVVNAMRLVIMRSAFPPLPLGEFDDDHDFATSIQFRLFEEAALRRVSQLMDLGPRNLVGGAETSGANDNSDDLRHRRTR